MRGCNKDAIAKPERPGTPAGPRTLAPPRTSGPTRGRRRGKSEKRRRRGANDDERNRTATTTCTDTTTPRSQPTTTSTYDATTTTHDHAYARGNMKRFQNAQRKDPLAFYILHKRYITSPLSHHTVAEHRLTSKPRGKQGRKTQKDRIQRQATKRNLRSFHGFLPCATDTQGTDKFHRKQTKDTTVFKMYGGVRSAARQLAEPDEAQTCEPAR